jgi:hypothetical protein
MNGIPFRLAALKDGHIVDPNGWTVVKCYGAYAEEYASAIIRAVNSHDLLLAAAKEAIIEIDRALRINEIIELRYSIASAERRLELAIAAAEEPTS